MNAARGLEVIELGNADLQRAGQYTGTPDTADGHAAPLPGYPKAEHMPKHQLDDAEFADWLDLPSFAPPLGPRAVR